MGYLGEIRVIPNGVDIEKFQQPAAQLKEKSESRVIISVSRRVYKNGLDILEKAFALVEKKFPDAELRILDNTPYEDIPKELHKADVFVRPSRSEGLGTAFLEAMAAGLPIIATPVGGIPDFLMDGETGLFAKVDDPKDLAEKIERLLEDEPLRNSLIKNGEELIEKKYQWPKIAEDMEEIFKKVI